MYIRYDGDVETKPNLQNKICGIKPAISNMTEQIEYGKGNCRLWSLLMGREFKPNQNAIV